MLCESQQKTDNKQQKQKIKTKANSKKQAYKKRQQKQKLKTNGNF